MKKNWVYIAIGVGIDQLTKYFATKTLSFLDAKEYLGGLLKFQLVHNYGAAYGILENQRVLLTAVALGVIVLAIKFYSKIVTSQYSKIGLSFVLIGAIGNVVDRIHLGYVVDFIDITIFPVFNLADVCIDIGVGFFVLDSVLEYRKKRRIKRKRFGA